MSNRTKIAISGGQVGHGIDIVAVELHGEERLLLRWDGGFVETAETLRAEVDAARASVVALRWLGDLVKGDAAKLIAQSVGPDGHGGTEKDRRAAFAAGLALGLTGDPGRPNPHAPDDASRNLAPDHPGRGGRAFGDGWTLGRSLRKCVELAGLSTV